MPDALDHRRRFGRGQSGRLEHVLGPDVRLRRLGGQLGALPDAVGGNPEEADRGDGEHHEDGHLVGRQVDEAAQALVAHGVERKGQPQHGRQARDPVESPAQGRRFDNQLAPTLHACGDHGGGGQFERRRRQRSGGHGRGEVEDGKIEVIVRLDRERARPVAGEVRHLMLFQSHSRPCPRRGKFNSLARLRPPLRASDEN